MQHPDLRIVRILNLGAGVQSTRLHLESRDGIVPWFDASIFADTQEEPAYVYSHLEWLKDCGGPPIIVSTIGSLGEHLMHGVNRWGGSRKTVRFSSIPAFTAPDHEGRVQLTGCDVGRVRRQCTKDYKVTVVEQAIRRQVLGLKPRQRVPKGILVEQYFGISYEERGRAERIKKRFADKRWAIPVFPLVEREVFREECLAYLKDRVPHPVLRSACTFCPYRRNQEWIDLQRDDPAGFARAVEIDHALRDKTTVANRGLSRSLYLHRKALPLVQIDFEEEARKEQGRNGTDLFGLTDCGEGMCGL